MTKRGLLSWVAATAVIAATTVGCSRSTEPNTPQQPADTAMRDASVPSVADPSGAATVAAFEEALAEACACRGQGACESLWQQQFEDVSRACVIEVLDRTSGATGCAVEGAVKITECLATGNCAACNLALLTEDTPLFDLIGEYCPADQVAAYGRELMAAGRCRER